MEKEHRGLCPGHAWVSDLWADPSVYLSVCPWDALALIGRESAWSVRSACRFPRHCRDQIQIVAVSSAAGVDGDLAKMIGRMASIGRGMASPEIPVRGATVVVRSLTSIFCPGRLDYGERLTEDGGVDGAARL